MAPPESRTSCASQLTAVTRLLLELQTSWSSKLRVYDAVDPLNPTSLNEEGLQFPQMAIDIAVSSDTTYEVSGEAVVRRIGVITAFYPFSPDRAANLWIVNLDNPENPFVIGIVSLYFPQDLNTVPLAVELHDGRAYIGNAPYHGIIVVDIQAALDLWDHPADPIRDRSSIRGRPLPFPGLR